MARCAVLRGGVARGGVAIAATAAEEWRLAARGAPESGARPAA